MSESKEEIIDFIIVVKYNGHNVRPNGSVDLNLISRYSEMVDSIRLLQLLNNDIVLTVKIPESKAFKLGSFRIGGVAFDHDGTAKIKFNGMTDFINTDNLNKLINEINQIPPYPIEAFNLQFLKGDNNPVPLTNPWQKGVENERQKY